MKTLHYNVIFRPEPEGGFTVIAPSLPGCVTYGKNLKEAREMAKDAITLYIQSLIEDGEEIPVESKSLFGAIDIIPPFLKSNKKPVYA